MAKKCTAESFEITDDSCFSYVGEMNHKQIVKYFNSLMDNGIWLDPDCSLDKRDWSSEDKRNIKKKMKRAFDKQDPIYGELAFGIICYDRNTGQFGEEEDFRSY